MKKAFFALPLLLLQLWAAAQGGPAEMADSFRANGKIYVVFAVILTIFAGIILYLVRLDRKISRFEKHQEF
jgi:hypothetical protein